MGVRRMVITAPCPACHQQRLLYTAADLDVPYFGQIVETIIVCGACGFKHGDVIIGRTREPTRSTYRVDTAEDMMVRVVRSTSGTVRIPELGVTIEPGPASEAFVSNVEGVLVRVERVLEQLGRDAESEEARALVRARLEQIAAVKEGRKPVTLVLEDPFGNSLIAHEDATQEAIAPEDVAGLARGEFTIDVADLEELAGDGAPGNGASG
jgi:zinc finger protein